MTFLLDLETRSGICLIGIPTVEITSNLSLNLSESVRRTVLGQYVELSA